MVSESPKRQRRVTRDRLPGNRPHDRLGCKGSSSRHQYDCLPSFTGKPLRYTLGPRVGVGTLPPYTSTPYSRKVPRGHILTGQVREPSPVPHRGPGVECHLVGFGSGPSFVSCPGLSTSRVVVSGRLESPWVHSFEPGLGRDPGRSPVIQDHGETVLHRASQRGYVDPRR